MPARRIVQDSDDEDNVDESPVRQADPAPEIVSSPAGTGSTERLNREIRNAQISLLDPSTSSRSSMPSSDSTSNSKKRAATGHEDGVSKKPRVTYGGRKSHDHKAFSSDSDDEDPIRPRKQSRNTANTLSSNNLGSPIQNGDHLRAPTGSSLMPPPVSRASGATQEDVHYSLPSTIPNSERLSSPVVVLPRKRAISETKYPTITLGSEVAPSSSAPASSPVKRAPTASTPEDDARLRAQDDADGGYDELSLSGIAPPINSKKQAKPTAKSSSAKFLELDDPDMGDLLPDIPVEKYQPRPSRSRSALENDDVVVPTDFSKRPESLAKKRAKPKRQKDAVPEEPDPPERVSPRKRQAKPPEAPDSKSPEIVLNDTAIERPDVEGQLILEVNTDAEVEIASPTKPLTKPPPKKSPAKKPRGRPKKATIVEETEHPSIPVSASVIKDDPTTQENSKTAPSAPPAPAPAKRGRKKKKPPAEEKSSAMVYEDPPSADEHKDPKSTTAEGVLSEANPNIPPGKNSAAPGPEVPETPKPAPMTPVALASKQTTVKTEEKTGKDSPAAYRIGLSKRQRIAPLLRVVRK
ncbi:MAG: hypothetical protein Q9168_006527 [Polycauliona sp. 1 TL-2023]